MRRPTATTVSAARMKAGSPFHSLPTLRAFSAASRWAWMRGNSPLRTVSSMAAGSTASGVMPAHAKNAMRRGLSLAKTSGTLISPKAIRNAALGKIIGRHLDHHLVAGQHADAVLAHLAGGVGDDHMIIGDQLHTEVRIWEEFFHDPLELQHFFLGQWVLLSRSRAREL